MRFEFVKILILRKKFCEMLRTAESIEVDEDRIALCAARILYTQVIRISEHGHDFFPDVF